jgi:hypothetical protein
VEEVPGARFVFTPHPHAVEVRPPRAAVKGKGTARGVIAALYDAMRTHLGRRQHSISEREKHKQVAR